MKYEQYTTLVKELEEFAEKNPQGYERLGEFGFIISSCSKKTSKA